MNTKSNYAYHCGDNVTPLHTRYVGGKTLCTENAIKYLNLWKKRENIEDLKKAKWYIEKIIRMENKE
jgi:hypothetical protein